MGESPDTEYTDIQKAIIMRHHLVQQKKEMLPVNWCPDDDPPGERPMSLQRVADLTPFVRSMQDWLAAHDREVAAKALDDAADHLEDAFGEHVPGTLRNLSTPSSRRLRARAAHIREGNE
jgi:hypothetical protein